MRRSILACGAACFLSFLFPLFAAPDDAGLSVVVCAPGYPGDTELAQPTMDAFARVVERAAGWPEGRVDAAYHPALDAGLAALADPASALAVVPLAFFLEYGEKLELTPLLEVSQSSGPQVWSLVARNGTVKDADSLAGFELVGRPSYSSRFVRNVVLAEWGALPESVRMTTSTKMLSLLRRVAAGEPVAALLDPSQASALGTLPFGAELEIVTRSRPLPASVVSRIGGRIDENVERELTAALLRLGEVEGGAETLETMQIRRFGELSRDRLRELERGFADAERPE